MSTQPAVHSPRRCVPHASPVLLLIALAATSCSRQPVTAPELSQTAGATLAMRGSLPPRLPASLTLDYLDQQFVVTLAPGADAQAVAAAYGATLLDVEMGIALMERAPGDVQDLSLQLKNDRRVLAAENNTLALPAEARQKSWAFDDGYGSASACLGQPAFNRLGLAAAQAVSRGSGVLVAVLDTGIDPTHPMFAGRIAGGWDFIDNDSDPTDVANGIDEDGDGYADEAYGHGTHVAGIVALTAPRAQLLIVRVLDADGRGDVRTVAAGIRWAVSHGARVINLSLGMTRSSPAVTIALAEAQAHGVVCVAAAGNGGAEFPQEFPASSSEVLAVAAATAVGQPASFTSYGTFVDLTAPGVEIRSAYPGGGYRLWSGTSMAAPFVSGTAAMLLSLHPHWDLEGVMTRLGASARPLAGVSFAQMGRLGAGALFAQRALEIDRPARNPDVVQFSPTGMTPQP